MSKAIVDEFRDLTSADVEILYNIVSAAQQSRDPPFRALFASYDKVLDESGISKDNDRIYFRFLLRMGENRTEGQPMFEQFELLLAKLGFQLDFSDDEELHDIVEKACQGYDAEHEEQAQSIIIQAPKVPRRASFESSYYNRPGKEEMSRQYDAVALKEPNAQHRAVEMQHELNRNDVKIQIPAWPLNPQENPARIRNLVRGYSEDDRARSSDAYSRNSNRNAALTDFTAERPNHLSESKLTFKDGHGISRVHRRGRNIEMPTAATVFEASRSTDETKAFLKHWQEISRKKRQIRLRMFEQAVSLDRNTLLRQAYEQWRTEFRKRNQIQETEKFFEQLEIRAGKARELFLLTKAFTHWAHCAADEVLRTSTVKKHIVRTRYFQAWRDTTVINELKVRRMGLAKFFNIWRQRTNHVLDHADNACLLHESRLIEKCYRAWFWQFCDRRAPLWSAENLKLRVLKRWTSKTSEFFVLKFRARAFQESLLARKSMYIWKGSLGENSKQEQLAWCFRRQIVMKQTLHRIRSETVFAPLTVRFEQKADLRLARNGIMMWRNRTMLSLEASQVDKLRIMRNAWTCWNDKLRYEALIKTINDRITIEALYKWVLMERILLRERVQGQRLKRRVLLHWIARLNALYTNLGRAYTCYRDVQAPKTAVVLLKNWASYQQEILNQSRQAVRFWKESFARRTLQVWRARSQHVQQLESWEIHARFYTLTARSITQWKTAFKSSRRHKRYEGYATMRRKVKLSVASRWFSKWRATTKDLQRQQLEACEVYTQHLVSVEKRICSNWRLKTTTLAMTYSKAVELYENCLLKQYLLHLIEAMEFVYHSKTKAEDFAATSVETVAADCLRKLNWQLFQVKRHEETAVSLDERNRRKHYRNMIRYWAEKTGKQRYQVQVSPSPSAKLVPGDFIETGRKYTDEMPEWKAFEEVHVERNAADYELGLTPGYLRTPSKRSSKTRARFQTPKTWANTQITPLRVRMLSQTTADYAAHHFRGLMEDDFADTP